jgi:hypothetical protein
VTAWFATETSGANATFAVIPAWQAVDVKYWLYAPVLLTQPVRNRRRS